MPRKRRQPSYSAPRPTIDQLLENGRQLKQAGIDFLKTDLDIALTFADTAMRSGKDPAKKERNRRNARRGYDTVLRMLEKQDLTRNDANFLFQHLQVLKSRLQELGETF